MNRPPSLFILLALLVISVTLPLNSSASEQAVIAPLAERALLLDLELAGERLVAVGERGHILLSDDSGTSWTQVAAPTRATLTGVFFLNPQQGWAVGHDQVILKSDDGGSSWTKVYQDIEADSPLFDIYFLNSSHGYAIGAYGQFLETFDGGNSWKGRWISEDDFHLNQIAPLGEQLFIAAEAGFIYRSGDKGATWEVLSPGYEGSFFGLQPLGEDSLLIFGLRGNMFRSDDSGNSWRRVETTTESSLISGLNLKDGRLVVAGLAGAMLLSSDGGDSFELIQDPLRKGFSRLRQARDGSVVGVGDFGVERLTLIPVTRQQGGTE